MINITRADIVIILVAERIVVVIVDLRRHNSKCPAVRLAMSRILKVKGRITFLTSSIITINLIKRAGVPLGTKWASWAWGCLNHAYRVNPTQEGRASPRVNDTCLEEVKI